MVSAGGPTSAHRFPPARRPSGRRSPIDVATIEGTIRRRGAPRGAGSPTTSVVNRAPSRDWRESPTHGRGGAPLATVPAGTQLSTARNRTLVIGSQLQGQLALFDTRLLFAHVCVALGGRPSQRRVGQPDAPSRP